ncbi:MAG: alpha-2-macroglobulin [Candidatus Thiodiazotropha sp.]
MTRGAEDPLNAKDPAGMRRLFSLIGSLLYPLFGRLGWQAPPWLHAGGRLIGRHPRSAALSVLLGVIAATGYFAYQQMPKPLQYLATVDAPGLTRVVDDDLQIDALRIRFDYDTRTPGAATIDRGQPSVANLELLDKPLTRGIRMQPEAAGTWRWEDDRTLLFKPDNDWPADQSYRVDLAPEIFKPGLRLAQREVGFTTPAFDARLEAIQFYQDPTDRTIRRVVATLDFSHAVDPASLEQHLKLGMRPSGAGIEVKPAPYDFSVSYDKFHRKAYIQSQPIELPEKRNTLHLQLAAGVKSALGPAATPRPVTGEVLIPDIASFFRVTAADSRIVRNQQNQPEQIVSLAFSDDVEAQALFERLEIYLLPKRKTRWQGPRQVSEAVLAHAQKLDWRAIPNQRDAEKRYNFRIDAPENRSLYLRIGKGLASIGRFRMSGAYDTILATPSYPFELKITHQGSVLAMSGAHRLGLLSRNLKDVKVRVGQVLPNQINHLISQTYGDISDPTFKYYEFNENDLSVFGERLLHLAEKRPWEANYASVDLNDFAARESMLGLFFVSVEGWDAKHDRMIGGTGDKRLMLVSDLGLIVKDNADASHDLFVQSIHTGQPVADAEIELLGRNGLPVMQVRSDADGHARLPSTHGLEREKQPTVYVVRSGGDFSFLPFERNGRRLDFSRFEVGGRYRSDGDDNALDALLFTDRGIYRPGETVNLAAIVRHRDLSVPPGIPLEVEIVNPRGAVALTRRLTLPALGFFDLDYTPDTTDETGYYDAAVYLIRDGKYRGNQIGSVRFQVEEFQPDRLKIKSRILGARDLAWVSAANLEAEVSLMNLFGTPARDRKVTAALHLAPTGFHFAAFKDYRFDDPLAAGDASPQRVDQTLEPRRTDAEGVARFALPLADYVGGTYRLTLDVQGYEAGGGRSVSASSGALLSPLASLVGYKADGDLAYLHKGGERSIHFIAIDNRLRQIPLEHLRLRLIERQNVSTLVRQDNGTYQYQTVVKEKPVDEADYAIAADGSDYRLSTRQPGNFVLELRDAKGARLASIRYGVVGEGNLAGNLEKNAELDLKLNQTGYRPGDTIEMNITAPYTGSGLLTIESDRVHAWKWFRSDTTSSLQTIRLPEGLEGNAYVNVAFVRAADSPEIYVSPLSYAVAPFSIDRSPRQVEIALTVPEIARPGKSLDIGYTASRPSRMVVFAVDEGILQVAKYRTPRPLDHFLTKRALEVATQQMADLILPEFALIRQHAASGGGMSEAMAQALGSNLNPFARKTDKPVAFWSGIVEAGPERRSVSFRIPDTFSGQLRVMAVAVSETAMGWAQQQTRVRGPFVISPNLLTVAAPGDEFDVSVGLANLVEGSGDAAEITLTAEVSEQLQILGAGTARLKIAEGGEGKATFRLKALPRPGAATVSFSAHLGEEESRLSASLSVRPASPYMASFDSGFASDKTTRVALPRRLYPALARQQVSASASPLVLVDGLENYLQNFPHGCTEQVVSQVFPLIGLMANPGYAERARETHEKVAALIAKLRPRQLPDGGFTLWPGGREVAEFPSVYVMHFLTEARALGYAVPDDIYRNGLNYLREVAARNPADLETARVRAMAIYLLTRNGEVTTNDLVQLQEWLQQHQKEAWRSDLVSVYMAATYQLLQKSEQARSLVSGYRIGGKQPDRYSDYQSPLTLDAQYVYLLANHFPARLEDLQGKGIRALVAPVFGGRYNTIGSAYTMLALGAYGKAVAADPGSEPIAIDEQLEDGTTRALDIARTPFAAAHPSLQARSVAISDDRPFFYQVSQAGYDLDPASQAITQGLEVQRDYLDDTGKVVKSLAQGRTVTVRLRIRSLDAPFVSNVAVIDLLPGGFEVLRDSVPRAAGGWSADYVDVREDRVVFYGAFGSRVTELRYRARLTASGRFAVPPAYAGSMYNRSLHGRSSGDEFLVTDTQ